MQIRSKKPRFYNKIGLRKKRINVRFFARQTKKKQV